MKKKNKKMGFSNFVVIVAILNITIFTIALFWVTFLGFVLSDTAITCFFSFWGIEMLSLAGIRKSKAKYNQSYEMNLEEQQLEEEEEDPESE